MFPSLEDRKGDDRHPVATEKDNSLQGVILVPRALKRSSYWSKANRTRGRSRQARERRREREDGQR